MNFKNKKFPLTALITQKNKTNENQAQPQQSSKLDTSHVGRERFVIFSTQVPDTLTSTPKHVKIHSFYVKPRRKIYFPQMSGTAILQQEPVMTSEVKLSETETICMLDKTETICMLDKKQKPSACLTKQKPSAC
jgi:hypothetical protein